MKTCIQNSKARMQSLAVFEHPRYCPDHVCALDFSPKIASVMRHIHLLRVTHHQCSKGPEKMKKNGLQERFQPLGVYTLGKVVSNS